MEFTINGKDKELKFGIGFIRNLDEVYKADVNGIQFGMGLNMAMIQLQQYNPSALSEVIKAAAKGSARLKDVDEAVEAYAEENDGLDSLFEEVIEEVGKSTVTKATLSRMKTLSEQN